MRNIPVFSTQNGVGSLILKEIPYSGIAYVRIQSTQVPDAFVAECLDFCKVAGAQHVYAAGHPDLQQYPLHTAVWKMSALRESLPDTDAALMPVTKETLEDWRQIYNSRMAGVANASYMSIAESEEMLNRGDGYFIHRDKTLLGIGMASGAAIKVVISCKKGAGRDVVLALNHALAGELAVMEVATANARAMRLYENLGFVKTAELSRWYRLF